MCFSSIHSPDLWSLRQCESLCLWLLQHVGAAAECAAVAGVAWANARTAAWLIRLCERAERRCRCSSVHEALRGLMRRALPPLRSPHIKTTLDTRRAHEHAQHFLLLASTQTSHASRGAGAVLRTRDDPSQVAASPLALERKSLFHFIRFSSFNSKPVAKSGTQEGFSTTFLLLPSSDDVTRF